MVAAPVAEPGLQGKWASVAVVHGLELPRSMGDLPGPGIEPASSALAGGFFTSELPGKPPLSVFLILYLNIDVDIRSEMYLYEKNLELCCQYFKLGVNIGQILLQLAI